MIRVAVLTISDSVAAGTREDKSGRDLAQRAQELGWTVCSQAVTSDDRQSIGAAISPLAHGGDVDVILTTGGTGVALRDVTPEAVRAIADREIPGLGELMRTEGRKSTKFAHLSRSAGYTLGSTLILTLPGSPRGAIESLNAVVELIPHVVDLLHGRTGHSGDSKPST
jgi:molybdenum cofactor synthesis domain-containing protein